MANQSHAVKHQDHLKESLSALMDGEASELELRRILKSVEGEAELANTWSRYQLVSSVMKQESLPHSLMDLSGSISEALADEPVPAQQTGKKWFGLPSAGFGSGLSKLGVAASVAAVMVFSAQVVMQTPAEDVGSVASSSASTSTEPAISSSSERLLQAGPAPTLPAGFQSPSVATRTVSSHPSMQRATSPVINRVPSQASGQPPVEVQLYLKEIMDMHAGNAALSTGHGMLPYARAPVLEE